MNLLLLNGSLRSGSVNGAVLQSVQAVAPASVQVGLFTDMALLPHFNPDHDHEPLPEPVTELRRAVGWANAVLICTPEYAGALPGSFKNLLDWLVGSSVMTGKPVGWVNASANPGGARDAHASLRLVLGYVGARVVQDACLNLPVPRSAVGQDGLIHDTATRTKLLAGLRALMEECR